MVTAIYLNLLKFKYICNYMLIYVKILQPSDHLGILHVNA